MQIKFTREQSDWIMKVTETDDLQSAVKAFHALMQAEGISGTHIIAVIEKLMKRGVLMGNR